MNLSALVCLFDVSLRPQPVPVHASAALALLFWPEGRNYASCPETSRRDSAVLGMCLLLFSLAVQLCGPFLLGRGTDFSNRSFFFAASCFFASGRKKKKKMKKMDLLQRVDKIEILPQ
jgi:hypothetical protein